ncbi:S-adenosyl-L-methionine-dependent methyltransferase [Xylariales sp. AK1849]|nr:S-adenosyl-L-methionine-dependent methyltransferase [Xylariales sp. AK1849]
MADARREAEPEAEAEAEAEAESYEREHVHSVYESIAPHFSATRYKPWPVIASFLLALPAGSVGLDVGCGNGKYLAVNPDVFVVGSDRSASLARIARDHGGERRCDVAVADGLALPFRPGKADFAICVAVVHHLSTRTRRREAVRALLDCVKADEDGGKVLVYVWALEQASSRRGWDEGADQDRMVPWVFKSKTKSAEGGGDTTYHRYYHLFKKGELEEDVQAVGGRVLDGGYDKDNWYVIASRVK